MECRERDTAVLDFDHLGEKSANVSRLVWEGAARHRLHEEMAKCVVRCANCHRRRTAEARGWFRFRALQLVGADAE